MKTVNKIKVCVIVFTVTNMLSLLNEIIQYQQINTEEARCNPFITCDNCYFTKGSMMPANAFIYLLFKLMIFGPNIACFILFWKPFNATKIGPNTFFEFKAENQEDKMILNSLNEQ